MLKYSTKAKANQQLSSVVEIMGLPIRRFHPQGVCVKLV